MYFKPELGSWDRLHDAAIRYPETTFTVVINPENGPGSTVWPTAEYIDAIESLSKYENIRILGYIDTDGGKRDNATIRQEIAVTPLGWKGHEVHSSITPTHTFISHVAKFQVFDPSSVVYLSESRRMGASVHSVTNFPIPLPPSLIDICSIAKHPDVQFLVILNPNSGPGAAPWWPNADYIREIPRLNALPNVKTLGYICATYCKRSLKAALDDIEIYGARGRNDVCQGVDGVFVDETVNLYSHEAKNWLDSVDRKVAHSLNHIKSPIVIHNPGTACQKEKSRA
ncbi:conserved hypothetical protein [Pyrenophora tritici-repentis Pt-1C-BFP]|uniref:Spherulin-4 n=1 Tax=Pyrenophora tritici-repentis (strain Pt-1C-BFP) TaxID=426418 RepID=B2VXC0_PYRTR|nr:uncharacterized protein PTRG_03166 [Pyrenophora tritici-repentis Pt-1C-BFP]EDU45689.1 conserved hypothetical protein [Pyrenophora tritici-repentis Pt-1C-BFP]